MPAALVRSHPRASDEGMPYLFAHRAQDARPGIPETPSICVSALALREEALEEWTRAETFSQVRSAWGRLGGRVTFHRYGSEHFREMARRRHA